jgi:hypothetical protein
MDSMSISMNIQRQAYSRKSALSVLPWEQRLLTASEYQAQRPSDGVLEMVVMMDNPVTGYGVEYEVLICAEVIPAQNGGMTDPSWPAHFGEAEAWYYREGRGWKQLQLDEQAQRQVERELDREMNYIQVYGEP